MLQPARIHRYRIINPHTRAHLDEAGGDGEARSVPQIVRVRLKGQAQQTDSAAFENEELLLKFLDDDLTLAGIHLLCGIEQRGPVAVFEGSLGESPQILTKATSTPTDAGT